MQKFMDDMVTKVSEKVTPAHNPLKDPVHPQISRYKREIFPVQAHVSLRLQKY
jgi:hypothetical protein